MVLFKNWRTGSQKKHDAICDVVKDEFKRRGFVTVTKNKEYCNAGVNGEIDVYGTKHNPAGYNYVVNVEVKSGYTPLNGPKALKARNQLRRSEENYFRKEYKGFRVFNFLYKHDDVTGELVPFWVRNMGK